MLPNGYIMSWSSLFLNVLFCSQIKTKKKGNTKDIVFTQCWAIPACGQVRWPSTILASLEWDITLHFTEFARNKFVFMIGHFESFPTTLDDDEYFTEDT